MDLFVLLLKTRKYLGALIHIIGWWCAWRNCLNLRI